VTEVAADAIDRPCRDDIQFAGGSILRQLVELRALLAALGAADSMVDVLLDHFPTALLNDPPEVLALVLDRLASSADAEVDPDSLAL